MKVSRILALVSACAGCTDSSAATIEAAEQVRLEYHAGVDTLLNRVQALVATLGVADWRSSRQAFGRARDAYKQIEYLAEYYNPETARGINGPPIPRNDEDDPQRRVLPPEGFQVVEELLFAQEPSVDLVRQEARVLSANVRRLRAFAEASFLNDGNIFDAARLELLRIFSLGLSGFDSPIAGRSKLEAAAALEGVLHGLEPYVGRMPGNAANAVQQRFETAIRELRDAEATWRLSEFAVTSFHPLYLAVDAVRVWNRISLPATPRAWRPSAATPFHVQAFDPRFFSRNPNQEITYEQIALGERLFNEQGLSRDSNRSCASCHRVDHGFAEPLARSSSLNGAQLRNAPSLLNAALQFGSFYDLRVAFLEDQVAEVIGSEAEMHSSVGEAADRLRSDYVRDVRMAFGDSVLTGAMLQTALAAYLRSLQLLDTPVDRYLAGDRAALEAGAKRGFDIFMGKARCGTCHFAPLFGGSVPPTFVDSEVEVIGVPAAKDASRIDPDLGRAVITRNPLHRHAFRTPSLRDVARTAPYMHNGVFDTLEEVIDFYDGGGGAGMGIDLINQTLPRDSLKLTRAEKADLVRFLKALTTPQ